MRNEILNTSHKFWNGFAQRLHDMVNTTVAGKYVFNCKHDLTNTTKILKSLPNIDIDATLAYFEEFSAYCDCEILANMIY